MTMIMKIIVFFSFSPCILSIFSIITNTCKLFCLTKCACVGDYWEDNSVYTYFRNNFRSFHKATHEQHIWAVQTTQPDRNGNPIYRSKPAATAVSYPIRAGIICYSHVRIPDWIVCGAGRFTPISQVKVLSGGRRLAPSTSRRPPVCYIHSQKLGSCTEFSARSAPIWVQTKLTLHVFLTPVIKKCR